MKHAWRSLIAASFLALAAIGLKAQAPMAALAEFQAEKARVNELWEVKKYGEAVQILKRREAYPSFSALPAPERADLHDDLACGMALLGRPSGEALAYLGMAVGEGFKDFHGLKNDPDLTSLRKDPGFTLLLECGSAVTTCQSFRSMRPTPLDQRGRAWPSPTSQRATPTS